MTAIHFLINLHAKLAQDQFTPIQLETSREHSFYSLPQDALYK